MAAQAADLPAGKAERYAALRQQIAAVIAGERNLIARYASATSLLRQAFLETYFWCGFYLVDAEDPRQLVIGPYQGALGCVRIDIGKGVCGAAAAKCKTLIVPDVHAFPGHIACDSRSNSEIVVPVLDASGALAAVLDVDSTRFGAFDEEDARGLEAICADLLTLA